MTRRLTPKRLSATSPRCVDDGAGEVRTLYRKARLITEAEARYIIAHGTASSSQWVVIQHMDQWFDVRRMTTMEITEHIEELDRKLVADLVAGIAKPH